MGRSHPQLEHQINFSRLKTTDEFDQLVCHQNIRFTAKCLVRLFGLEENRFIATITKMGYARQQQLLAMALTEGLSSTPYFADKIAWLKQFCQQPTQSWSPAHDSYYQHYGRIDHV
jgi:3-oxoacyl-[acyl-carrier-protein] synthase III